MHFVQRPRESSRAAAGTQRCSLITSKADTKKIAMSMEFGYPLSNRDGPSDQRGRVSTRPLLVVRHSKDTLPEFLSCQRFLAVRSMPRRSDRC